MFRVEVQGAVDVLSAEGSLNQENSADFQRLVAEGIKPGKPMLVLNMKEVPLIDSAGLEALLEVQHRLQQLGGDVKLAALSPLCAEILRITRVESHFESYREVKTAVGSFSQ